MHQSIIGLRPKPIKEHRRLRMRSLCRRRSNFAGLAFPYGRQNQRGNIEIIPVERTACPTLTRGPFAYDYGDIAHDSAGDVYTGSCVVPPPIHAGGLRYHGMLRWSASVVEVCLSRSRLIRSNAMKRFDPGAQALSRTGNFPRHRLCYSAALKAKEKASESDFNYSGHGHGFVGMMLI